MANLLELADRCEKATGQVRELDFDIFQAVGGEAWDRAYRRAQSPCGCPHDMAVKEARYNAQQYTASIDAAMTLVPEGLSLRKEWLPAGSWPARCYIHKDQSMPLDDADFSFRGIGKSEALALCAAALRARAATDCGKP